MGMKQIWDGDGIPPNGCDVLINLASSGAWERYTVDGFSITKADGGYDQYTIHVALHRISCNNKIINSRLLGDIRPLDYLEGATS